MINITYIKNYKDIKPLSLIYPFFVALSQY